jgi:hypothetical protein
MLTENREMIIEVDNFLAFLNNSENILKEKIFSQLSMDDENKEFNQEFKEALFKCFCHEETKNGYFFGLNEKCPMTGEEMEKLLYVIYHWFDVSTFCIYDGEKVEETLNVEKFKNSLFHIPLIVAYKCSIDTVFKIQRIVGEFANIIWLR